jgi:hypothetical protein
MTHSTSTYQVTTDLDNYLKDNDYFDGENETAINQIILDSWDTKFKSAITADFKSRFDNVEIDVISSEFELSSDDNRGACLFFHKLVINDKRAQEFINVFVKTLVNYNITTIYLDSSYATVDEWQGESKNLKLIFAKLKTADKRIGYFNPLNLTDFVK